MRFIQTQPVGIWVTGTRNPLQEGRKVSCV